MADKGSHEAATHQGLSVPEYFAKILKSKDRIIRAQAKRIEALEGDVQRLRLTRETLNTQLALLSYKLQLATGDWDQNVAGAATESKLGQSVSRLRGNGGESQGRGETWKSCDAAPDSARNREGSKLEPSGKRDGDRDYGKLGLELCDGINHLVDRYAKKNDKAPQLPPPAEVAKQAAASATGTKQYPCSENRVDDSDVLDEKCLNYIRGAALGPAPPDLASADDVGAGCYGEDGGLRYRSYNMSAGSSPCESPSAFQVDQPSFCFEYQLEDGAADDGKDSAQVSGTDAEDGGSGGGCRSPIRGPLKPWQHFSSPYGDGSLVENSAYPYYVSKNSSSTSFHMPPPLNSIALSKYSGVGRYLCGSPLTDLNVGNRGAGAGSCRCCADSNAPCEMGHSPEMLDKCSGSPAVQGQPRWRHQKNLIQACNYHQSILPTPFARMGAMSSSSARSSPIWKRKSAQQQVEGDGCDGSCDHHHHHHHHHHSHHHHQSKRNSEMTDCSEHTTSTDRSTSSEHLGSSGGSDSVSTGSGDTQGNRYHNVSSSSSIDSEFCTSSSIPSQQMSEKQKRRHYRIGLNLFNRKPERGISYLIEHHFLENNPLSVAKFLVTRKGLSKQMIGEYLGNLQLSFNMDVLSCFVAEINLTGLQIDEALRKFQSYFQMPGEAQKIERLMEAFARCYSDSNPNDAKKFVNPDAVFLLAYAIVMLNTDLHNSNIKADKKMKLKDFVRNFRGIDGNRDIDENLLSSIYNNISVNPLRPANDHVTQVVKVDQMIVGKKPQLVIPHRRLVCFCRLSEIPDPASKPDRVPNHHYREVFLFNDLLMVTKLVNKKKSTLQYSYRQSFLIFGMMILLFETPYYKYGIQLASSFDGKVLMNFCAQDEQDRKKFIEDLQETILEVNEMETLRTRESETEQMADASYSSLRRSAVAKRSTGGTGGGANMRGEDAVTETCKEEDEEEEDDLLLPSSDDLNILCGSVINISEGCRRLSSGSLDSGLPSTSSGSVGSVAVQDRIPKYNIYSPMTGKLAGSSQHLDIQDL